MDEPTPPDWVEGPLLEQWQIGKRKAFLTSTVVAPRSMRPRPATCPHATKACATRSATTVNLSHAGTLK